MAWQDVLGKLYGGGLLADPRMSGAVGPEAKNAALIQGLLGTGASLLQASGPTTTPVGTAAAIGGALQAGQQGYAGSINQTLQGQDMLAKREQLAAEQAARQELDKLLASGNVTQEQLLSIATRYPEAQNVIQQYMKGMQGQSGPSQMQTQQLPDGSTVFWDGQRWQRATPQRPQAPAADPGAGIQAKIDALRNLGASDAQIATALGVKAPTAPKASAAASAAAGGGFNARQAGGARQAATAAVNYAAALTGLLPTQLSTMSPEEVEKAVIEQGGRLFQGPVLGEVPFISSRINSDLTPFAESMAASQALVNNPAGPVTKPDVDTARVTVPNPRQPIEVQAKQIRNLLEQAQQASAKAPAAAGVTPPAQAIEYLRSNPRLAPAFDAKYGPGASARVLGGG